MPDVLRLLRGGGTALFASAAVRTQRDYDTRTRELVHTLDLLLTGSLAGVFDGPTTPPLDLDAPGCQRRHLRDRRGRGHPGRRRDAVDLVLRLRCGRRRRRAGRPWAGRRGGTSWSMDEGWRALRGAAGLVDHADALTRLNRSKGIASLMITHSLADLEALPTPPTVPRPAGSSTGRRSSCSARLPRRELDAVTITPWSP